MEKYIVDGQEVTEEALVLTYRIALLMEDVTRIMMKEYFGDSWSPSCEMLINVQYQSMKDFIVKPNQEDFYNVMCHGKTLKTILGMNEEDEEALRIKGMKAFTDLSKEDQLKVMTLTQELICL